MSIRAAFPEVRFQDMVIADKRGACAGGGSFLDDAADAFLAQGIAPNDPMGFEQAHPAAAADADGPAAEASESSDAADSGAELDNDYRPRRRRRRAVLPAGRQRQSAAKARPASAAARGKAAAAAEPILPVHNAVHCYLDRLVDCQEMSQQNSRLADANPAE
jgi:hypothetical protein